MRIRESIGYEGVCCIREEGGKRFRPEGGRCDGSNQGRAGSGGSAHDEHRAEGRVQRMRSSNAVDGWRDDASFQVTEADGCDVASEDAGK
ncbi:MAG: hypothetical protein MUE87_01110 [Methanothrix sp.]|nr:hypothetical protein [Methanothrix sp.]